MGVLFNLFCMPANQSFNHLEDLTIQAFGPRIGIVWAHFSEDGIERVWAE